MLLTFPTMTSPTGLWTTILRPRVWHYSHAGLEHFSTDFTFHRFHLYFIQSVASCSLIAVIGSNYSVKVDQEKQAQSILKKKSKSEDVTVTQ